VRAGQGAGFALAVVKWIAFVRVPAARIDGRHHRNLVVVDRREICLNDSLSRNFLLRFLRGCNIVLISAG
jgi:hypothetical protein